jgi:hypothetical protein
MTAAQSFFFDKLTPTLKQVEVAHLNAVETLKADVGAQYALTADLSKATQTYLSAAVPVIPLASKKTVAPPTAEDVSKTVSTQLTALASFQAESVKATQAFVSAVVAPRQATLKELQDKLNKSGTDALTQVATAMKSAFDLGVGQWQTAMAQAKA